MNDLKLFEHIFSIINTSNERELVSDLISFAIRYAQIRVEWFLADKGENGDIDEKRTRCHNSFIDCCNILSRQMNKLAEDISWRELLGNDRKIIGDFACYIHFELSIKAR